MFCLLCLQNSDQILNIFNDKFNYNPIVIIPKHFWFTPSTNIPTICSQCWNLVETFHTFYMKVKIAHANLGSMELKLNPNDIKDEEMPLKEEVELDCELAGKNSDSDILSDKEQDKKEENIIVKKSNSQIKTTMNISKKENLKRNDENLNKPGMSIEKLDRLKIYKENDAKISSYVTLSCDICQIVFASFLKLRKHYLVDHKVKGFVKCCNRKFFRRHLLADHINTHINADYFKCTTCSTNFTNRESFKVHMTTKHKEGKKFECDQCSKSFLSEHFLLSHKNTHHLPDKEDKKFPCTYTDCTKNFSSRASMYTHIHCVHKKPTKICDLCGKTCRAGNFRQHQLKHTGFVQPKAQCHICNAHVNKRYLRFHLESHENSKDFICSTCGKKYPNSKALYKHVSYMHKITKTTHPCSICTKEFKSFRQLEQHMPVHTNENNFVCKYCNRAFKFSSTLHGHKKKEHPIELEEEKLNRATKKLADRVVVEVPQL